MTRASDGPDHGPASGRPLGQSSDGSPAARVSLFAPAYRTHTAALVGVITLVAFEALAVATAMPTVVADLHGLRAYGWPFTAYLLASIVGMVWAGGRTDHAGPRQPLLVGIGVFGVGLLTSGLAGSMAVLVVGRAVQGLGGGAIIVAVYVVIARVYPEELRPRVFAAISAAWVLPAIVGPALAGLITEHLTWRLVFLGLVPPLLVGLGVLNRSTRGLPSGEPQPARPGRLPMALLGALGMACLQQGALVLDAWSVPLVVCGVALLVLPVRRLLPPGTAVLARGLPSVVAFRGIMAGAFFGAETFVPLALTTVHGARPAMAGLPLTVGALGWAAGSWWQGHRQDMARWRVLRAGMVMVGVGVGATAVATLPAMPVLAVMPAWTVAAAGMGLAMPAVGVLLLDCSPLADQGVNSAALQIADLLGSVVTIAAAGAVRLLLGGATTAEPSGSGADLAGWLPFGTVFVLCAVGAWLGALAAHRVVPAAQVPTPAEPMATRR